MRRFLHETAIRVIALAVKYLKIHLLQSGFSPRGVAISYLTGASSQAGVQESGPDPGSLSLSADDGRHVLFERGDTLLQVLREVLQQTALLVHKQSENTKVTILLHTETSHMYNS